MKKTLSLSVNHGFLVMGIELSITLSIIMLAIVYGYPRYSRYMQHMEWNVAANHMTIVGSAAKSYIHDKRQNLVKELEGGKQKKILTEELIRQRYLPKGFSSKNTAGQIYQTVIMLDPHGKDNLKTKLVAFVLTEGGQEMPYTQLRYISQKVDGAGGYTQKTKKNGKDTVIATGAFGGWKFYLNEDYKIPVKEGHLITWLSADVLGTDTQDGDRLYRVEVVGYPQLNKMETHLNMGGYNINAARNINAKRGNFKDNNSHNDQNSITATHNITSEQGWLITHGDNGWKHRYNDGNGDSQERGVKMIDKDWIQSLNGGGIGTEGKLEGGQIHATGNATVGNYLELKKAATRGERCDTLGLQAKDKLGALLSCVAVDNNKYMWESSIGKLQTKLVYGSQVNGNDWAVANCGATGRVVSGGYRLLDWGMRGGNRQPVQSRIDIKDNGWAIKTAAEIWPAWSTWQVIAVCASWN